MKTPRNYLCVASLSIVSLLTSILCVFCASNGYAANKPKLEKERLLSISVRNLLNDAIVPDTITVDLMRPDSTLILSNKLEVYHRWKSLQLDNRVRFNTKGQDFIVRLSHPDYETVCHKVHIDDYDSYPSITLKIRKLTRFEKAKMLDEVVVTASVIEFVNKGDTIQYNADAFELAEGSMLKELIGRLPGAELKENGQIYVNGRFVDKLLLDGKDFFKNDKLVLLQNLPAYTVKNVQVYEERLPEQLARKSSGDPDYVMNVRLKKDYNVGWLANAEAGGGTHSRYRLRGFGLLYNAKSRFAAYGLMNNLNETGQPSMDGRWNRSSNMQNEIITRGGGFDYNVEPNEKMEFSGNATVQYNTVFANSMVNTQNYIPLGDNYSRRWNNSKTSGLRLDTYHNAGFLTSKVMHDVNAAFSYGTDKSKTSSTEGTFAVIPGDYPSMQSDLQTGMPDTLGILNRYLSMCNADGKHLSASLNDRMRIKMPKGNLLFANVFGSMSRRWSDSGQQYLLQYTGSPENITRRTNPNNKHDYEYGADLRLSLEFGKIDMDVSYNVANNYTYTNTMFYDFVDDGENAAPDPLQQWQRMERMQGILDAGNSYTCGQHSLEQELSCLIGYRKSVNAPDGTNLERMHIWVMPSVKYLCRKMDFNGFNSQRFDKNTWMPGSHIKFEWQKEGMGDLQSYYSFKAEAPEMFDLLDVSLNSDPMNPTLGNPNLKYSLKHAFWVGFNSRDFYREILSLNVSAEYVLNQNTIVYATSFNQATGIRTTIPANVNGNRYGKFEIEAMVKPLRDKNFSFTTGTSFEPSRFVTLISVDGEEGLQKSVSHVEMWQENLMVQYRSHAITGGLHFNYGNRRVTSRTGDFNNYTTQKLYCGVNGLVRLPLNFEISTSLGVQKYYGSTESSLNKPQVIWNARISKSIMNGNLLFSFEGYDILQKIKRTEIDVNAALRRESRYNSVPSFFLFSIKYFFAKKPRK